MANRPVEPGIVKLGVRSGAKDVARSADVRRRLSSWAPSLIVRCKSCFYFYSFLAAFAADGPGSRDVNDLPDRSPGLARVHACAKEASGWGWALAEEKHMHLFVPRSRRRCKPPTRGLVRGTVKDRALGYSGISTLR